MMRRIVRASSSAAVAATATTVGNSGCSLLSPSPKAASVSARCFTSNYGGVGDYKPPLRVGGRSGAHRRPIKQSYSSEGPTRAAGDPEAEATGLLDADEETEDTTTAASPAQRNYKNNYRELFKPKKQPISFTSSFKAGEVRVTTPAQQEQLQPQAAQQSASLHHEDDDVTKIYSHEEVARLVSKDSTGGSARGKSAAKLSSDDTDVLRALGDDDGDDGEVVTRTYDANDENDNDNDNEDGVEATDDKFSSIRGHPFYADLIERIGRNMTHYQKEIRSTGRFSTEAINDCVRPLLQLADYPFTTQELAQLAGCFKPAVLADSLSDRYACSRMRVYRSPDTDIVLDWSVEDFLRRRYESVHLSWEPMDVVCRRFGWTGNEMSDRDLLLYFSEFGEYVELAELEFDVKGKPKAVPVPNPVERAEKAPISSSRLLIRRVPDGETEPSITEAVRLMGTPAMSPKEHKRDVAPRRHHGQNSESVEGMFSAVERAAEEVDGDEASKLNHGMDSVRSLKQATHPGGRTVNEFAIGKRRGTEAKANTAEEDESANGDELVGDAGDASRSAALSTRRRPAKYDPDAYERLSNAFHKTKVEIAMLRRRLLGTNGAAKVESMQSRLASQRRELSRLNEELRHMSALRRQQQIDIEEGKGEDDDRDDPSSTNVEYKAGFAVPKLQPVYMEAPELDSKNGRAAANDDDEDDDDIDISEELQEYEQAHRPLANSAAKEAASRNAVSSDKNTTKKAHLSEEEGSELPHRRPHGASEKARTSSRHRAGRTTTELDLIEDFNSLAAADDFDADEYVSSGNIVKKPKQATADTAVAEAEEDHEAAVEHEDGGSEHAEAAVSAAAATRGKERRSPRQPQYQNAPERDPDEVAAAEEEDDDDDNQEIAAAIQEYEAELKRPRTAAASHEWKSSRAEREDNNSRRLQSSRKEAAAAAAAAVNPRERSRQAHTEAEEETEEVHDDRGRLAAAAGEGEELDAESGSEDAALLTRSEALALVVEKSSAAVDEAKAALERLEVERDAAQAAFAQRIAKAEERVGEREAALAQALHDHREAVECEAREAAEAKAQAVERELEVQREKRMAEVARQREQARLAQVEAQKAVERQRAIEQEALAKEKELEQKLAKVRAQLRAVEASAAAAAAAEMAVVDGEEEEEEPANAAAAGAGDGVDEADSVAAEDVTAERATVDGDETLETLEEDELEAGNNATAAAAAAEEEEEEEKEALKTVRAAVPERPDTAAVKQSSATAAPTFMCSPEQYDGLHLAAERLRTEISALEQQMEQGGDEDDETLMAVLAESRADLEELDDCIASVQQNAPWAAARDAKREQEKKASAHTADTEAQRLQAEVDNHRFQIGLLEKRLHHATQRSVSNKLEQGIIAARREIVRLRREQDRLRREGRDAFGLPASVSIAESLAEEGRNREKLLEAHKAAANTNEEPHRDVEGANAAAADGADGFTEGGRDHDGDSHAAAAADQSAEGTSDTTAAATYHHLDKTNADPEAHRLHLRLDSMLHDIQQLQDNIAIQERTTDYDDEETESVLLEMKTKLGQLLNLRNAVQQRLAESGNSSGPAATAAPVATPPSRGQPVVADHTPRPVSRFPSSRHSTARIVSPASKKLHKLAHHQRR